MQGALRERAVGVGDALHLKETSRQNGDTKTQTLNPKLRP